MGNSNIENFWNTFEANKELETIELLALLNKEIKSYSQGLYVELSSTKAPKELIITPQGIKVHFAHAYELLATASEVQGWEFRAGKPALGEGFDFVMDGLEIKMEEITFMPLESADFPDDIAIRLYHKAYVPEEGEVQNRVISGLYSMLDAMLGEESATFDFQYIDFDDMPHPKEKDYPLALLPSFIQDKKAKRANAGERFPKEDIGLLEGKVEELPTLLVINNGLKYYEFTKEFPYLFRVTLDLKNVGENGLPKDNTDELYKVEDIIYKAVSKEEKGHFIATETYNAKREMFYYVDSLESIEKAIEALPKELETCAFSYEVNYDPFWVMVESYIYM